ncbi:unnamed protein product, partial [Ectocarpus fasciculatus]
APSAPPASFRLFVPLSPPPSPLPTFLLPYCGREPAGLSLNCGRGPTEEVGTAALAGVGKVGARENVDPPSPPPRPPPPPPPRDPAPPALLLPPAAVPAPAPAANTPGLVPPPPRSPPAPALRS